MKAHLQRLTLTNFQIYSSAVFEFSSGLNFVCAPNGSGKSTIANAVCFLCLGTSKILNKQVDLSSFVKFGSDFCYVEGVFVTDEGEFSVKMIVNLKISKNDTEYNFHDDSEDFSRNSTKNRNGSSFRTNTEKNDFEDIPQKTKTHRNGSPFRTNIEQDDFEDISQKTKTHRNGSPFRTNIEQDDFESSDSIQVLSKKASSAFGIVEKSNDNTIPRLTIPSANKRAKRHKISKIPFKITYFLNNEKVTRSELKTFYSKHKVDVISLTNFLPQERVSEFVKMTGEDIFQTLFCSENQTSAIFTKIKESEASLSVLLSNVDSLKDKHSYFEKQVKDLQDQVDLLKLKEQKLLNIYRMKVKIEFLRYDLSLESEKNLKSEIATLKNEIESLKDTFDAIVLQIKDLEEKDDLKERELLRIHSFHFHILNILKGYLLKMVLHFHRVIRDSETDIKCLYKKKEKMGMDVDVLKQRYSILLENYKKISKPSSQKLVDDVVAFSSKMCRSLKNSSQSDFTNICEFVKEFEKALRKDNFLKSKRKKVSVEANDFHDSSHDLRKTLESDIKRTLESDNQMSVESDNKKSHDLDRKRTLASDNKILLDSDRKRAVDLDNKIFLDLDNKMLHDSDNKLFPDSDQKSFQESDIKSFSNDSSILVNSSVVNFSQDESVFSILASFKRNLSDLIEKTVRVKHSEETQTRIKEDEIKRITQTICKNLNEVEFSKKQDARFENLSKMNYDAVKACSWLDSNRSLFKGKILKPLLLNLQIKNYLNEVETLLNTQCLLSFVCTNYDDFVLFTKKLKDDLKLRVNATHLNSDEYKKYLANKIVNENEDLSFLLPKSSVSRDSLNNLGFCGYAIDFVSCEIEYKIFLCQSLFLHNIPIFTKNVDYRSIFAKFDFKKIIANGTYFECKKSKYNSKDFTIIDSRIKPRGLFKTKGIHDEEGLKKQQRELEAQLKLVLLDQGKFKDQIQLLKDFVRGVSKIIEDYQSARESLSNSFKIIQNLELQIKQKENHESIDLRLKELVEIKESSVQRIDEIIAMVDNLYRKGVNIRKLKELYPIKRYSHVSFDDIKLLDLLNNGFEKINTKKQSELNSTGEILKNSNQATQNQKLFNSTGRITTSHTDKDSENGFIVALNRKMKSNEGCGSVNEDKENGSSAQINRSFQSSNYDENSSILRNRLKCIQIKKSVSDSRDSDETITNQPQIRNQKNSQNSKRISQNLNSQGNSILQTKIKKSTEIEQNKNESSQKEALNRSSEIQENERTKNRSSEIQENERTKNRSSEIQENERTKNRSSEIQENERNNNRSSEIGKNKSLIENHITSLSNSSKCLQFIDTIYSHISQRESQNTSYKQKNSYICLIEEINSCHRKINEAKMKSVALFRSKDEIEKLIEEKNREIEENSEKHIEIQISLRKLKKIIRKMRGEEQKMAEEFRRNFGVEKDDFDSCFISSSNTRHNGEVTDKFKPNLSQIDHATQNNLSENLQINFPQGVENDLQTNLQESVGSNLQDKSVSRNNSGKDTQIIARNDIQNIDALLSNEPENHSQPTTQTQENYFDLLPNDIHILQRLIHKEESELKFIHINEESVKAYKAKNYELQALRKEEKSVNQTLETKKYDLLVLKNTFISNIFKYMQFINQSFDEMFRKIGCEGKVHLNVCKCGETCSYFLNHPTFNEKSNTQQKYLKKFNTVDENENNDAIGNSYYKNAGISNSKKKGNTNYENTDNSKNKENTNYENTDNSKKKGNTNYENTDNSNYHNTDNSNYHIRDHINNYTDNSKHNTNNIGNTDSYKRRKLSVQRNSDNSVNSRTFTPPNETIQLKFHRSFDENMICDDLDHYELIKNWKVDIYVKYRKEENLNILSSSRQSGGEKSVATMIFLLSIMKIKESMFKLVDEINQGMDKIYEKKLLEILTEIYSERGKTLPQLFLITPKILENVNYRDSNIIVVYQNVSDDYNTYKKIILSK